MNLFHPIENFNMSKQQDRTEELLSVLYPDMQSEVGLEKITKILLHKGIRVDIYLPSIRCIVEVHGIQHHKPSGFGKNKVETQITFINQLNRDSRLKDICSKFRLNYEQIDYNEKVTIGMLFRRFAKYSVEEEI